MRERLSSKINNTAWTFVLSLRCCNHSVQVISYSLRKLPSVRVDVSNCHYTCLLTGVYFINNRNNKNHVIDNVIKLKQIYLVIDSGKISTIFEKNS